MSHLSISYTRIGMFVASALIAGTVLTSCSAAADLETLDTKVSDFHKQLDAKKFHSIYDNSSEQMKKATTEKDLNKFLTVVHKKLGNLKQTTRNSFKIFVGTGGTRISAGYTSKFESGAAEEQFSFLVNGKKWQLEGYNINSNDLIMN